MLTTSMEKLTNGKSPSSTGRGYFFEGDKNMFDTNTLNVKFLNSMIFDRILELSKEYSVSTDALIDIADVQKIIEVYYPDFKHLLQG